MTYRLLILVSLSLCLYSTSIAQKSKLQGYLYNDQEEPEGRVQIRALPAESVTTASNGHSHRTRSGAAPLSVRSCPAYAIQ